MRLMEDVPLELTRVERITKEYDKQGRIARETVEFYFPEEQEKPIGFKSKK